MVGAGNINSLVDIGRAYRNHLKAYSLSTVNGFLINPNVFVGIGIGIEKVTIDYGWPEYLDTRVGHFIPLYLDTRFYLLKKQVTQFFYTDMGYSWGRNAGESGSDWAGVMGGAGTGVVYRFTKVNALSFSVGCKIQQIKLKWIQTFIYPNEQFSVQYYEKSFSYFIVTKIGISF